MHANQARQIQMILHLWTLHPVSPELLTVVTDVELADFSFCLLFISDKKKKIIIMYTALVSACLPTAVSSFFYIYITQRKISITVLIFLVLRLLSIYLMITNYNLNLIFFTTSTQYVMVNVENLIAFWRIT